MYIYNGKKTLTFNNIYRYDIIKNMKIALIDIRQYTFWHIYSATFKKYIWLNKSLKIENKNRSAIEIRLSLRWLILTI